MNDKFLGSLDDIREEQDAIAMARANPDLSLITDYLTGELTPEQEGEVRARLDRDAAFAELAAPLMLAYERKPHPVASRETEERRWLALRDKLTGLSPEKQLALEEFRNKRRRRRIGWTAAIAALLMITVLPSINPVYTFFRNLDQRVPPGATQIVQLQDGSTATLASGSKIVKLYEMSQANGDPNPERWLTLVGDAHFDINPSKDKPWVVRIGAADIRVIGTKFHVHAYDYEPGEITVTEGTVSIQARNDDAGHVGDPILVHAGQRVRVTRGFVPEILK